MPCLVTLVPEVFWLSFIEGEAVIIIGKTENPWDQGIINVFFVNQLFQIKIKNKKRGLCCPILSSAALLLWPPYFPLKKY